MPPETVTQGRLCQGLNWRQWNAVLGCGRRQQLAGQCWLETFTNAGEVFALLLKGRVSRRPASPDQGDKIPAQLSSAPAIIELSTQPDTGPCSLDAGQCNWDAGQCNWVGDLAEVYFYNQSTLREAFDCAPGFALNFVEVLCAQHSRVTQTFGDPAPMGVARLANSLLAHAGQDQATNSRVWITQAELACETGLSRQWVNRLLRGLEKRGIARLGRGYVELCLPDMLHQVGMTFR
ncbi:MAG: Crp/Fnr family transcriptional regulator [Hyphomicrobiales bacterium]